jgi:acylpyruvate hydrolase
MKKLRVLHSDSTIDAGKIICVGRNYAEHAREMHAEVPVRPVLFLKPPSALLTGGEPIIRPAISKSLHYEVELVVIMGKGGSAIPERDALSCVFGYAVGLDMTLRDIQAEAKSQGLPWSVAKGFDTSAPVSSIVPAATVPNPRELGIRCLVNGSVRQQATAGMMIFSIEQLIAYVSTIFSLEAGDLLFTGTPEGVGEVVDGDVIEAQLTGYTSISHPVRSR